MQCWDNLLDFEMAALVVSTVSSRRKGLEAEAASKGLLARMGSHVYMKVPFFCKYLATMVLRADEQILFRMEGSDVKL